jgi:D-lactate dehydrogenase
MGKVLFVEVEDFERRLLEEKCGACRNISADFRKETLDAAPADALKDIEALSAFIYSRIDQAALDKMPALKFVATRSTGFDHIDMQACRKRGVLVSNIPTYGENTVAEHTFALILNLTRKIHKAYERTIRGDFSLEGLRGTDLYGKTLGVIGTGKIGLHVVRIARGFLMKALAYDPYPNNQAALVMGFDYVPLDTLFTTSDIVTLHCPLTPDNKHMIDAAAIAKMKQGVIIINTARGGLIEPDALLAGLKSGKVGGAGLDVLEAEQAIREEAELLSTSYDLDALKAVVRDHIMLRMENVIITPHNAFNSVEAITRIAETTVQNIRSFFEGRPQNIISY